MNDNTNPDSPENIEARKTQPDPIVMYLVVRESLGMSTGKTAAQCAHASQKLLLGYFKLRQTGMFIKLDDDGEKRLDVFEKWLDSSFRKVVLKANESQWNKLKNEFVNDIVLVTDCGLTELMPNTDTVIGIYPMYKSEVPKTIKRLQAL